MALNSRRARAHRVYGDRHGEKNVPTQQQKTEEQARLPRAHGHAGRAEHYQPSASPGPEASGGLTRMPVYA
jgi:hypothetical protein